MTCQLKRREFLKTAAGGCALCAGCNSAFRIGQTQPSSQEPHLCDLISPGCRKTKVRVAKIYMGVPGAHWPTPSLDLNAEIQRYEDEFASRKSELADVDFVCNHLVSSERQARRVRDEIKDVDGILLIHLSMRTTGIVKEILAERKPTILFAAPYSGHEWTRFGAMTKTQEGALLDCILTSDFDQLAAAVRPIRAIHHLREAKIINISTRPKNAAMEKCITETFNTEIKQIDRDPVLAAYETIPESDANAEAKRWIANAQRVVEPGRDEIFRSCRLALAFQKLLDEEKATAVTADCYGSMFHQLPAFPCIGFVRLNNMGLAGICESDIRAGITFMMLQSLTGRPGFISDPTVDLSKDGIILAHCLGTPRMDGPGGPAAPYRLRTIMERQEGAVPQVFMRIGQTVTQAILTHDRRLLYFTGTIIEAPDTERGCRTKITVKVDGDPEKLWRNWSTGLHRVTCYGDITDDLKRLAKFKNIKTINEA